LNDTDGFDPVVAVLAGLPKVVPPVVVEAVVVDAAAAPFSPDAKLNENGCSDFEEELKSNLKLPVRDEDERAGRY
jgi:hypothetical protein